jgi:hypothetical protein
MVEENNRTDFKRTEIKNISKISGISVLNIHYLIYNFSYYKTIHMDYMKYLKNKRPYYKNNIELLHAIDNGLIKEFGDIKDKYHAYIKARLGYTKRYIDKKTQKRTQKQYEKIKNTNEL